jgi:hypothetical protein
MSTQTVMSAALPTWFKIQLAEAAAGTRSYFGVGWHLGYHHPDTFDLDEGTEVRDEDFKQPTRMLRRLFASEEHPKADLVDYIPSKRRADFLRGLSYGLSHCDWAEIEETEGKKWRG